MPQRKQERTMAKLIEINPVQAERLHDLAQAQGTSEDALIEEALELLFRQKVREEALTEDLAALRSLSAPSEAADTPAAPHRDPCDFTVTHAILIPLPDPR